MDWQQITAYAVVALTAVLMVRSQFRRLDRRRKGGCGGDCCGTGTRGRITGLQRRLPEG